jgi:hypothetical protein
MRDRFVVFNAQLELFGYRYITKVSPIQHIDEFKAKNQEQLMLAVFFEQLLLFDKVAIKVDRQNLPLFFLLIKLGINNVERLIDEGALEFVLWTPVIVSTEGKIRPDNTIDESAVLGVPPLLVGSYTSEDSDPERNLDLLLSHFTYHTERKRIFKRKALRHFVLPDNTFAEKAKDVILDAYTSNRLVSLGLEYQKEPDQLERDERKLLLKLGHQVLETALLAEKKYKSYDVYSYHTLTTESVRYIESALKVSENTSEVLQFEGTANLQRLVLDNLIAFEQVYKLRHRPAVRHYRKWINNVSVDPDAKKISIEYMDAIIKGNPFFRSNTGKFIKTVGMFTVGTGVSIVADSIGLGAFTSKAADLGLGLLDTYVLDGILSGWNPRMFVNDVKKAPFPDE